MLSELGTRVINKEMGFYIKIFFVLTAVACAASNYTGSLCGCKLVRQCYMDMVVELQDKDEAVCMEDIEIGASTMMVYFTALQMYCGDVFNFKTNDFSYETRNLYEVNIHEDDNSGKTDANSKAPIILIDAGQVAGQETVILVMSFIERLIACQENEHMIQNIRWVFLPCVNPDGMEYVRFDRPQWSKNTRRTVDGPGLGYGVDISRNFDANWADCEKNTNGYSPEYPGTAAASEVETRFVRDVILKYGHEIKAYLSIRREGHAILYPHAYSDKSDDVSSKAIKLAELISLKVNQRGSTFQTFVNNSIYNMNGKPQCGSSVDYAHSQGISLSFEFRVGFGADMAILKSFFYRPKGFEKTLRSAYFSGLRELYVGLTSHHDLLNK